MKRREFLDISSFRFPFQKLFSKQPESKDLESIVEKIHAKNGKVRFRVARNLKNKLFPFYNPIGEEGIHHLKSKVPTSDLPPNSRIYFNDEDHIRYEVFPEGEWKLKEIIPDFLNRKDLFEYSEGIGFINSCPTNTGRGNKASVSFQISFEKDFEIIKGLIRFYKYVIFSESEGEGKEKNDSPSPSHPGEKASIMLYIKNFNNNRLKEFLQGCLEIQKRLSC